ncbi:MAG: hypothetical protein Kow00121_28710 [Elainellaceae cyanobacterium]
MRDALVVGINTYQALPSLKAPATDAEAIANRLQTDGEFRVHRLPEVVQSGKPTIGQKTQVSLRELETALINLFKPKGSNVPHTALFYFSGHGIQREAGIREGYLALSDSQPEKGFYGLSLFWLRRLLQESPVRQRIVILDCCHSGELLNFLEADPGAHAGTDRLFMAASREYETAFESLDGPYSVFTQAILEGLDPNRVEARTITNHSLTDYVNHALKGEIQQPLFESSGSEIILTRQSGVTCPAPLLRATDICPYRGLECFDETNAEYFFGRENLTAKLVNQLKNEHIVAVIGASGIGKSSLVRAGLISQLRKELTSEGDRRWRIKLLTPAENPLKSLAAAFIDTDSTELERAEQLRRAENFLQDGSKGLAQLVRASLAVGSSTSKLPEQERPRLLLVIDQFEEAFSLAQGSQSEQERKQFFDCLLEAMEMLPDCLSVVVVLRTDFLTKCSLYEGLVQKIEQHQFVVPPLKYEQIKATIIRPAQKVGLVCEPSLIYTMLFDVSGAPGELPLLQYTLLELWQRRRIGTSGAVARLTLDAYQELGGIRGTLQKRATEVFFSLTEREQTVAKRVFLSLTQLGEGTEDTRRRVARSELVSAAYPIELVEQVLEKLVAAKLIIMNPEVDVIHEALIRNWPLLRTWLGENREMLRRLRRVEQLAQEWNSLGQPSVGEYLLSGLRLRDAEDFLKSYPQELSTLAQQFIAASHQESRRARRESRQLQVAVPSFLVATLAIVFSQYYSAVQSHAEKDRQLQLITARERAAIAQSILQASDGTPETALLVSRVAAEQGGTSLEAQASLRTALRNIRLQLELRGHSSAVHQLAFSPDRRFLASAGADGTVRLWQLNTQQIYTTNLETARVLQWSTPDADAFSNFNNREPNRCQDSNQAPPCIQMSGAAADITALTFSPDGHRLAAIAKDSPVITLWSADSGTVIQQMVGSTAVTQIRFSPNGDWIATAHSDRSIAIWQVRTGRLMGRVPATSLVRTIRSLQFSANSQQLMIAVDNAVQLWSLKPSSSANALKLDRAITLSHPATVNQAMISPKGRWIATASSDGAARLWDAATGRLLQTFVPQSQRTIAAEQDTVPAVVAANQSQLLADDPRPLLLDLQPSASVTQPPAIALTQAWVNALVTPIMQVQFSPNEQTLAVADANHQIWLWDITSGQIRDKLSIANTEAVPSSTRGSGSSAEVSSPEQRTVELTLNLTNHFLVATSPNASADGSYSASLWDIETGDRIGNLFGHQGQIEAAQFAPDGSYVVTADADGVIRLWSTEAGELPTLSLPEQSIASAMFIDRGRQFSRGETLTAKPGLEIASSQSQQIVPSSERTATPIADLITATPEGQLQHWQIMGSSSTGLPASGLPASPSSPKRHTTAVEVTNQPFWQRLLTLLQEPLNQFAPVATNPIHPLQPSSSQPASEVVQLPPQLSLSNTLTVRTVAVEPTRNTQRSLSSMTLSPNGQLIATATPTGQVAIYEVQADQSTRLIHQMQNWRSSLHSAASFSELAWRSLSTPMFVASHSPSPAGFAPLGVAQNQGDAVMIRQLSFSPDQHLLMGIADDFTIRLWDVQSGQLLQVLQGHEAAVQQARFSPDGERVVTASWDRTVRIWRISSGRLLQTLALPDAISISTASFSPDGQRVITASGDGIARIFQAGTGELQLLLRGHQQALVDAQFSPDGQQIVTAGADGTVYLWNAQTGTTQAELRSDSREASPILQVSFSPDGQYLAALTKDGKVHLWAATWEMLLNLARNRSFRQLTPEECDRYLNLASNQCPVLSLRDGK